MLRITTACILAAVARMCLANYNCGDPALDALTITINMTPDLAVVNGYYTLIAKVNWEIPGASNVTLDGLAVQIEHSNNDGVSPILLPLDYGCDSGTNHVWVITKDRTICEPSNSFCSSGASVENACLCLRNNCTILASSVNCSGFWDSVHANFDYTVLPTTRTMQIPIQFDVGYDVTIIPYYRGNVGVSRTTESLKGIGGCDERIFGKIRDEVDGGSCVDLSVVRSENVSIDDPTTYDIEFQTAVNGPTVHKTNGTIYSGNTSIHIYECGLDPCQDYFITVYAIIGGIRTDVISTFNHTTSSPFEDGSLIAPLMPTTVATTTIGTTADPTNTAKTQTTEMSSPPIVTSTTIDELLCNTAQVINNLTFPKRQPGLVSYSLEKCNSDQTTSLASILCSATLKRYDLATFRNSTCESINQIVGQNFTNSTLEKLQISTANVTILTSDNVTAVAEYLRSISNLGRQFSEKEIGEAAEISSHLTEYYRQGDDDAYADEKQKLVQSLSRISRKIEFNFTAESPSVSKLTNDVNIEVAEIPRSQNRDYEFDATFYDTKDSNMTFNPISIRVPAEAFDIVERDISTDVRIVSIGFRSNSLFPSQKETDWVISSELGDAVKAAGRIDLPEDSVTITDHSIKKPGTKKLTDFKDEYTRLDCVFWDFGIGDWSDEGCSLSSESPAACQCDHLTNFAILVSRFEIPPDVTLSVVTYVGCGLSIIGLLLTLLVICLSRKLRGRYQMRILGNICLCLAIALLLFVFGVGSQVDTVHCTILTVFMHFFFLSAWFWTAVYSYTIYRDIAQVMSSYGKRFKLRLAAVFAYGIPLVIVLLNSSIALAHIDDEEFLDDPLKQSSYRARNFCWLHSHSLYFGFLLAVGVLLVFNIAVFCIVVPKVTCRRTRIQSSKDKTGIGKHVATVSTLVTTMGLSWVFGFLMLASDNHSYLLAMSWLFTIVNGFQGIFIFYFTAVRSGELRQLCAPINRRFTTVSTVSTGVSSSEIRS